MEEYPRYELGPSRPPSEAHSLLLRLTRSCPWNRCEFCTTNKGKKFSLRTVEEIKKDIKTVKIIQEKIKMLDLARIYEDPPNDSFRVVALWLYFGGRTVFLQDADSIIMRTPDLVEVLQFLKQTLPAITRITSYGSSRSTARKSLEELKEIHGASKAATMRCCNTSGKEPLPMSMSGAGRRSWLPAYLYRSMLCPAWGEEGGRGSTPAQQPGRLTR